MMTRHDAESGIAQLTCPGGGAAVCKTNTGLVVALFVKDKPVVPVRADANKARVQTLAGCAE